MAVIMLCSLAGAPGATTTALGLAHQWPRRVLLADCDPAAPQAIVGGYLGGHSDGRGMMSVLHALRRRASLREALLDHTQRLDAQGRALLLAGFNQPTAASIFTGWDALAEEFGHLDSQDMDVIIDAGRLGPAGPPPDLVRLTDLLLVTARSSLRSLVALRTHLAPLVDQVEATSAACSTGLAVIGPGRPYTAAEIASHFGLPVHLQVEWAPSHAEVLSDAGDPPRRFEQSTYVTSLVNGASRLHAMVATRVRQRNLLSDPRARRSA